jgi:hypothetical protein
VTLKPLALPVAALVMACVTHGVVVVTGGSMEPTLNRATCASTGEAPTFGPGRWWCSSGREQAW